MTRAVTNLEYRHMVGAGGRRAIDVHKTLTIHAPVEQVYALWTDFEQYPRFMSHVREIRRLRDGTWHWVVDGPAGAPVEWDAVITKQVPNKLLAWKTAPGVVVAQAGVTRFDTNPDGSTRVIVRMTYHPPAGAFGHVVATLFGCDPKHQLDDDLLRFKSLLEFGKTTAHGCVVTREEVSVEETHAS
jgi:uncharacterized membrane protein